MVGRARGSPLNSQRGVPCRCADPYAGPDDLSRFYPHTPQPPCHVARHAVEDMSPFAPQYNYTSPRQRKRRPPHPAPLRPLRTNHQQKCSPSFPCSNTSVVRATTPDFQPASLLCVSTPSRLQPYIPTPLELAIHPYPSSNSAKFISSLPRPSPNFRVDVEAEMDSMPQLMGGGGRNMSGRSVEQIWPHLLRNTKAYVPSREW